MWLFCPQLFPSHGTQPEHLAKCCCLLLCCITSWVSLVVLLFLNTQCVLIYWPNASLFKRHRACFKGSVTRRFVGQQTPFAKMRAPVWRYCILVGEGNICPCWMFSVHISFLLFVNHLPWSRFTASRKWLRPPLWGFSVFIILLD